MHRFLSVLLSNLRRWLERQQPSGLAILSAIGVILGLVTGAGVWFFKQMIVWTHTAAFGWLGGALSPFGPWTVALLPALGGLLVGLLWHYFVGEDRYHGVSGIMEAVALVGGRLEHRLGPVSYTHLTLPTSDLV